MQPDNRYADFLHPVLEREVTAIGGHYVFTRESRLLHEGREVLYLVGYAVLDASCCGVGGCAYALVAGFVAAWKYKKNDDGLFVSRVEPIRKPRIQETVGGRIKEKEGLSQVSFG